MSSCKIFFLQVSTWTLRHVVSHFASSEEPLARARGPERQYRLVYHIFPRTKNRKGTQEPVLGHTSVKHLLGSHFEADDHLRDGGQNKAARSFTKAGRFWGDQGSEGIPWRTISFSQTILGSIKSFWGGTLEWHVRKAAVQLPSLNQGARRCLESITPRVDQGTPL